MDYKLLIRPAPIQIGQLSWSFAEGVTHVVDSAPEFQQPAANVRAAARIVAAVAEACAAGETPGRSIVLRKDDWQLLQSVTEGAPVWGNWQVNQAKADEAPLMAPFHVPPRVFVPWLNAVDDATNKEDMPRAK